MAYYRTSIGKIKKQQQNSKRGGSGVSPSSSPVVVEPEAEAEIVAEDVSFSSCCPPQPDSGGGEPMGSRPESIEPPRPASKTRTRFDREMVLYLAMVVGLIEGRVVSFSEVEALLCHVMRQHSMARRRQLEYAVWYLNNPPP